MLVRYSISNLARPSLGQSGKLINPGTVGSNPIATDTPLSPPSNMIQPAPNRAEVPSKPTPLAPNAVVPAPVAPEAVQAPHLKWVNEGGNNLTRTLLAVGTVAALAAAGIYFLK